MMWNDIRAIAKQEGFIDWSLVQGSQEILIEMEIKIRGYSPINNIEEYYLEDGEIVRRFRHDIYPPMRMGI